MSDPYQQAGGFVRVIFLDAQSERDVAGTPAS